MKHVWTWNISHFSKFLWWVFCMINKSNVYEHKIENSEWRHWTFMRFFYINNSRCYTINRWSISRFKKIRETKQTMRLFLPRRILEMHLKRKHIICQQAELRFSPLEYFILLYEVQLFLVNLRLSNYMLFDTRINTFIAVLKF